MVKERNRCVQHTSYRGSRQDTAQKCRMFGPCSRKATRSLQNPLLGSRLRYPSRHTTKDKRARAVCVRETEGTSTTRMRKRDAATATLYISVTRACAPEFIREPKTRTCTEFELKFQTLPVSLFREICRWSLGRCCLRCLGCWLLAAAISPSRSLRAPFLHLNRCVVLRFSIKATVAAVLESTRLHLWMYNGGSSLCSTRWTSRSRGKPNQQSSIAREAQRGRDLG